MRGRRDCASVARGALLPDEDSRVRHPQRVRQDVETDDARVNVGDARWSSIPRCAQSSLRREGRRIGGSRTDTSGNAARPHSGANRRGMLNGTTDARAKMLQDEDAVVALSNEGPRRKACRREPVGLEQLELNVVVTNALA